jgi:hypothetical protein
LPKNLGTVKQLQILNDTNIFVSTGNSFLKLNSKAQILQNFDFKKFTNLNEILRFKALKNGKIIAADADGIYRLNADGTGDATFNTGTGIENTSTGLDFDMQENKIIWGSDFNGFNGTNVHKLIRLDEDGSLDTTFNIGAGPDNVVFITKVLNSGDIIVGGWFSNFNGIDVPHEIVKLSKNGEISQLFNDNQYTSPKVGIYSLDSKVEQVDSVIFIKEKNSITAFDLNGALINSFDVPIIINSINDIITMKDSSQNINNKKSASAANIKAYMFAIGSFNKSNSIDPSFVIKLNIENNSSPTEVPELSTNDIQLYPIPVTDKMKISFTKPISQASISIFSITGQSIYSSIITNNFTEVDMSKYDSGVYIVKIITSENVIQTRKIVKQ